MGKDCEAFDESLALVGILVEARAACVAMAATRARESLLVCIYNNIYSWIFSAYFSILPLIFAVKYVKKNYG